MLDPRRRGSNNLLELMKKHILCRTKGLRVIVALVERAPRHSGEKTSKRNLHRVMILPTRSMIQMDPVAFHQTVVKETAFGVPKTWSMRNPARTMRHRTAAHIGDEERERTGEEESKQKKSGERSRGEEEGRSRGGESRGKQRRGGKAERRTEAEKQRSKKRRAEG